MEILLAVIAVAAILTMAFVSWDAHRERDETLDRYEAVFRHILEQQREERAELLNRIQHPERAPRASATGRRTQPALSPETRKGLREVGTVAPQSVTDGD